MCWRYLIQLNYFLCIDICFNLQINGTEFNIKIIINFLGFKSSFAQMLSNPDYVKENLEQIGIKEGLALLRELIDGSNDPNIRKKSLKIYGTIDNCKNFKFLELCKAGELRMRGRFEPKVICLFTRTSPAVRLADRQQVLELRVI